GETYRFLTLDDPDIALQVRKDPVTLLTVSSPTIIDEVQRAPELLLVIKQIIDRDRSRRFILSGSANLLLMKAVTESLAGRAAFLELGPLTLGEIYQQPPSSLLENLFQGNLTHFKSSYPTCPLLAEDVWQGGMPLTIKHHEQKYIIQWREAYIETY